MMKATLRPLPTWIPAIWHSTNTAPTIRMSPSVSNPNWVIQLKKLTILEPRRPNGAREIVNAVVPASGPCSDARPRSRKEMFPMMMMLTAFQKLKPKPMSNAP